MDGAAFGDLEPLLIISGMFPPMHGGLPDHTDRLAHALSGGRSVTVLTSAGVDRDRPFGVAAEIRSWHDGRGLVSAVRRLAPEGPILWQYVPHMYGRGGVNRAVPWGMERLKRDGRRQVVIAHEIRAPYSLWPHRSFYAAAHRWMWRRVRGAADAIGISTAGWLERLRLTDPSGDRLFLAPSPSNLSVVPVEAGHRAAWCREKGMPGAAGVVGFFGSVGTGKQFDWVLSGWRQIRRREPATALVVIGGRPEPELMEDEREWFKPLGYLDGDSASRALQAMDLLMLPFEDGVSERRSSFMAGLAHGLAVVTTHGEGTGEALRGADYYRGVPVTGGRDAFAVAAGAMMADRAGRGAMARRAGESYAALYDWRCLAATLGRQLGLVGAV